MPSSPPRASLFPALLKYWRGQRGLSQLDLALAADVSARHISFLETGRSTPSADMVLRLSAAFDLPLRHVNALLESAGHPPAYRELAPGGALPDEIAGALRMMKAHHEPFPLLVIDRAYDVLDLNDGARVLLGSLLAEAGQGAARPNLVRLTFDPRVRPLLLNFDEIGRALLSRLQREALSDRGDERLRELLDEVLAMPTVSARWRHADLSLPSSPTLLVRLRAGDRELSFLAMVTVLQAPQRVALDELRIETWFPADDATAAACRALQPASR